MALRCLLLSLLFLFLDASCVQAQIRTGYGINLFPNSSHRRLALLDNFNQPLLDSLEMAEGARPSFSVGPFVSFRGNKVGFQVGINYAENGFSGERLPLPITDPFANRFTTFNLDYRARSIEVPFAVHFYQEISKKNDFFFMMGGGLSYSLSNHYVITRYAGDVSEKEVQDIDQNFRKVNFSFQTSMGWERRFGENLVVSLAPTFRLWLSGSINDFPIDKNFNIYHLGLRLTFRYDVVLERL